MNVLGIGWYTLYAFICVCVQLINARGISVYVINPRIHDLRAIEMEPIYGQIAKYPPHFMGKKLIPIKEPRPSRNLALPLEPDAEMLPAHYERVKPPGVDHMELKYAETQIVKDIPKIQPSKAPAQTRRAQQSSEKQRSEAKNDKNESQKTVSVEIKETGDDLTEKKKVEYVDAAGRKKVHDDHDRVSKHHTEKSKSADDVSHAAKSNDKVDRVATGYRNIYHKDEYKKNHDFYDNDDHGGHSKQHGRYNERHVSTEGTFKKGDSHSGSFDQGELQKEKGAKNSGANGKTKGHDGFV
nr:uncharacterized protein LOC117611616 [Osmia lignaria]